MSELTLEALRVWCVGKAFEYRLDAERYDDEHADENAETRTIQAEMLEVVIGIIRADKLPERSE